MMKKLLNYGLFISFLFTIMVPLTGIHIHKLVSTVFLILSIVHICVYRKKLNAKRWGLFLLIVISFVTGLFGMILDHLPVVLILHRVISIAIIFLLAIHTYIFHRRLK